MTVIAGSKERYFSPESEIWRINRERVLLLAGGRALLMQIAHPKVAAGVAEHSDFQVDPFARLQRTMDAMWSIVFDDQVRARAALERIESRHRRVHGVVPAIEQRYAGMRYDAFDQDLLLWVHATLIDSAMVAYDRFVRRLSKNEKSAYYQDSKTLAGLFGIAETILPASLVEFDDYMLRTLAGGDLAVGSTAQRLARDILYARPWIFKIAGPPFRFVTAGLLPERLREGYDLTWSEQKESALNALAGANRALLPLLPAPIRIVPNARAAETTRR